MKKTPEGNTTLPANFDTTPVVYASFILTFCKILALTLLFSLSANMLFAQSGGWDAIGTVGTPGNTDHGSGVIQLLNSTNTGCAGAAVHENTTQYNPCSGTTFNQCYQVFFDCPGNDNIGSDGKGDGMAFSFSSCAYNINSGLACGGGLGYMGACPKMITVEFDTYSSQGNSGFDATYGGGTTGMNDEIALHRDGDASDAGRITSSNVANLEDGNIHQICINYNPTTHILTVTIDGATAFTYNFTSSPYDLSTYFGCGGLNLTWSAGKFGATSQATVSNGAAINPSIFTGCTVLPVDLLSFTAKNTGQQVLVDWVTAKELNNDRFFVERSSNLSHWEAIGEVVGLGTTTSVSQYSFIDENPLEGVSYYRLRQRDLDGTTAYSRVAQVQFNTGHFTLSPNPFEDVLTIHGDISGNAVVKIYDVVGRLVWQQEREANGIITIQPDLPTGTYLVVLQTSAVLEQWKVIKK